MPLFVHFHVALRIMDAPSYRSGSERFSVVPRLVAAGRNWLGDAIIADVTFLKSVFTDPTFEDFAKVIKGPENWDKKSLNASA